MNTYSHSTSLYQHWSTALTEKMYALYYLVNWKVFEDSRVPLLSGDRFYKG